MKNILRYSVLVVFVVGLVLLGNNQVAWADTAKQGTVPVGVGQTVAITEPGSVNTGTSLDIFPDGSIPDGGSGVVTETDPVVCQQNFGNLPGSSLPLSGCIGVDIKDKNGNSVVPFPKPVQVCYPAPFLSASFFAIQQWVTPPGAWESASMYEQTFNGVKMLCTDVTTPGPYILGGH